VRALLQHGASVDALTEGDALTPLVLAVRHESTATAAEMAALLLDGGANASLATAAGATPLALCVRRGAHTLVSLLCTRSPGTADPNQLVVAPSSEPSSEGATDDEATRTLLHVAIEVRPPTGPHPP
jgi:ankyrin repeat protein